MERRQNDRLARPGRRLEDRRVPTADHRRVLLAGADAAWRLLSTYLFEEAGYVVYAAGDGAQAVRFTTRLLPDVVVVQMAEADALDIVMCLTEAPATRDIPVVVLTPSLQSIEAHRARAAGGVVLLPHLTDGDVLVGEVDTLIAAAPRAQRSLTRRLLDLQELARCYVPVGEARARMRHLIDHLQVAILAVDHQGRCIAASEGAAALTGYSRLELLTTAEFHAGFAGGAVSADGWRELVARRRYAGTTTILNRAGDGVMVHAAVAEILPGFHVAAFAAA